MNEGLIKICSDEGIDLGYMQGFVKACADNGVGEEDLIKLGQSFWRGLKDTASEIGDWGKKTWNNMGVVPRTLAVTGATAGAGTVPYLMKQYRDSYLTGDSRADTSASELDVAGGTRNGMALNAPITATNMYKTPQAKAMRQGDINRRQYGLNMSAINKMAPAQRIQQYGTRDANTIYNQQHGNQSPQAGMQGGMAGAQAGGMPYAGYQPQQQGYGYQQQRSSPTSYFQQHSYFPTNQGSAYRY